MGTILHTSTKKTVVLAAYSVVGRGPTNLVQLTDAGASAAHASISWNGKQWEVRDLGSMNGTSVNSERVPLKERVALSRGSILRFGTDTEQWELVDDGGPVVVARCLDTGETRAADDGLLILPDEVNVQLSVVMDEDDHWSIEAVDGSQRPAENGEQILIAGHLWEITVPPGNPVVGTHKANAPLSMYTLTLRFHVSMDEEHIKLDIVNGDQVIPLRESVLFETLLLLARKRIEDASDSKLPEKEQGWYDAPDLYHELGVDELSLNRTICRLRNLFIKTKVDGGRGVVERRTKKLRIGTSRLQIE